MSSSENDGTGASSKKLKTENRKDDNAVMSDLPAGTPSAETEETTANNSTHQEGASNPGAGETDTEPELLDGDDDDAEPDLLQDDSVSQELFPNAPCVTVAKRDRGGKSSSTMYLNRYGPRRFGWFVWSSQLKGSVDVKKLKDVGYNRERVLDYPRKRSDPRVGASEVLGTINIVWECQGLEDDPLQAAELLNPQKVKYADRLSTMKARQDWLKDKTHKLDKYPVTYVDVKFSKDMSYLFPDEKGPFDTRWELASKYKSLHPRTIEIEYKVYRAALNQAKRFLAWYRNQHPESFDDKGTYRRSESREPTTQPFNDKSPSPGPGTSETRETSVLSTTPDDQTREASAAPDATKPGPAAPAGKPGRDMVIKAAATAYKMNTGKTDETMSDEDKLALQMFTKLQLRDNGHV